MTALLIVILVLVCLLGVGLIYILLRLVRLETTPQTLQDLRLESRSQNDNLAGLQDTASVIRSEVARAQNDLAALQAHLAARQQLEQRSADSLYRLEMVIAGTQSKGVAGENVLDLVFGKLPAEWQARNLRVGNKVVEFGLRLPNNLVLPIDSKWPASHLLDRFIAAEEGPEKQRLKGQIERSVLARAKEVVKYLDPNLTTTFGLAVVPDGVYDLCGGIQSEAYAQNVIVISYSLFIPYLLLIFHMVLATCSDIDRFRLEGYLHSAQQTVDDLQKELEGRFSHGLTLLGNSRGEMAGQASRLRAGLLNLRQYALGPETDQTSLVKSKSKANEDQ